MTEKSEQTERTAKAENIENSNDIRIKVMDNFLKGYLNCKKQLRCLKYEQVYFGKKSGVEDAWYNETRRARENMKRVHDFIKELDNGSEKLLLYFHYVKDEPIERCAELLSVSRSSAFRMRKRALAMALQRAELVGGIVS